MLFFVNDLRFEIVINKDGEIILNRMSNNLDHMMTPKSVTERDDVPPKTAIKLFRCIRKYITYYMYTEKPFKLYWTTGGDTSRYKLYKRFAENVASSNASYNLIIDKKKEAFYLYRI